jgi:hypothetical protein
VETAAVAIAACADVSAGGIGNPDKG